MSGTHSRVGIAVFGAGRAGTIHVPNVIANTRAKLLYVVEEDVAKAKQLLQNLKAEDVQVVRASEAAVVLQDTAVEAVMICSPTPTHERCVMDALQAGKAVFCEKPLSNEREAIGRVHFN